jgi:predicted ATPase
MDRGVGRPGPIGLFADLAPCRNDEQVLAAIVECAGIRGTQAAAGLDAVVDMVSGRGALLVVDNCEHVLAAARRNCDLLAGRAPGLRLLVTSRTPLDVGAECVWRVPPMAVTADDAGSRAAGDAVALFFTRAAMAGVTLKAGPVEAALAGRICRRAGCRSLLSWRQAACGSLRWRSSRKGLRAGHGRPG